MHSLAVTQLSPTSPFDRSNIWPGNGSASSEVVTRHSIPKIGKFEFYASVINSSAPSTRRKRVPSRSIPRVSNLLSISSEPIHYFVWLDNVHITGEVPSMCLLGSVSIEHDHLVLGKHIFEVVLLGSRPASNPSLSIFSSSDQTRGASLLVRIYQYFYVVVCSELWPKRINPLNDNDSGRRGKRNPRP